MRGLAVKGFYKIFIIVCFFVFSLFFLASTAQCQPWSPYQSPYQSPPININLNLGGFSGGYSSGSPGGYPMGNNYMGGLYGMGGPYGGLYGMGGPYRRTSSSKKADNDKIGFIHSASDGEYIYLPFDEGGGQDRGAVAILDASGSDDYEYLSHVTLGKRDFYATSASKMIVKDNLLVIGAHDEGTVYLVDITDKEDPELINKLNVGEKYQSGGRSGVTGLAIEGDVLFVSIEFLGSYNHIIFSLDISNPEETDEDDDLLDYYILDADDCQEIYNMVSAPGYLYIAAKYDYDPTILIMDIAKPKELSLVETLDMKGEDQVSVAVNAINGDYLLAAVEVERGSDGAYKLKVIDISVPETPEIISSSEEFSGQTDEYGSENMVIKDDYAYVFLTTTDDKKTKIYVFDISDPEDPDLVETSRRVYGSGLTLYLVDNDRLCLHTTIGMEIFDISNPENISVDETVDIQCILGDELDDWGEERSSPSYSYYGGGLYGGGLYGGGLYGGGLYGGGLGGYSSYDGGYSSWNGPSYGGYGGPSYGGYGGSGSYGYGGPAYGGYGGYGPGGYSGWGGPAYGGYGGQSYGGYGGPPYGGYPAWGYSGWVRGRDPAY